MTDTPDLQGESTSDTPSQSTSPDLNAVADRLSRDRLSKYLIRTDNNVTKALELYSWNNKLGQLSMPHCSSLKSAFAMQFLFL
jgi:hypothetical protein